MTSDVAAVLRTATCPPWCVSVHGEHPGEEDWIHLGEPLVVADDTTARLCTSIDPATGVADGPYVLIGSHEYSVPAAAALGSALVALASVGATHPLT